ncbi:MAG: DegQ family serine endoprotease [Bdellovibrionales bacterium]|nr:DegQ family serine endoprotease [Bdellovibrionales bacterium]
MKLKCLILISVMLAFSHVVQAKEFWMEGKANPKLRVNQDIEHLSPQAYRNISQKYGDSVVNISTVQTIKGIQTPFGFRIDPDQKQNPNNPFAPFFGDEFFDRFFGQGPNPQQERKTSSLGSGFVLNAEGYVVTNNHVIANADEIRVTFVDETEFPAEVVGRDPKTDVALLKIKGNKKVTPVLLGSSQDLQVGDIVVAIGNPFGLSHSVTQGIVSAKERTIGLGPYDDFIQTDASINPGNSGGPLLDIYGEVIGINTAIHSTGQGIGFAIPIDMAKDVLVRLKEQGQVIRGYLGVRVQEVQAEHVKALGLSGKQGALVMEVLQDTPAAKAKIEPGDVITKYDDQVVKNWNDLPLMVAKTKVGKRVKVELIRNKSLKTISVLIEKLEDETTVPASTSKNDMAKDVLGLQVTNLNATTRKQLGLEDSQKGVLVEQVDPNSSAAQKGVAPGDVIVRLNRVAVNDIDDYKNISSKIKKDETVLVLLIRQQRKLFIAFTLGQ